MTVDQMESLRSTRSEFLEEFADCFGRCEPRGKLSKYVRGQLSELRRKSAEPMALAAGISPRTLQEFLASDEWDQERLREHTQSAAVESCVIMPMTKPSASSTNRGIPRRAATPRVSVGSTAGTPARSTTV